MTEAEKRQHRACFTGHRPEKLACSENDIHALLNEAIDKAIDDGYRTFISGMARGVDIMAAEIILKKKPRIPPFALYVHYPTQILKRDGIPSGRNVFIAY